MKGWKKKIPIGAPQKTQTVAATAKSEHLQTKTHDNTRDIKYTSLFFFAFFPFSLTSTYILAHTLIDNKYVVGRTENILQLLSNLFLLTRSIKLNVAATF